MRAARPPLQVGGKMQSLNTMCEWESLSPPVGGHYASHIFFFKLSGKVREPCS